VGDLNYDHLEFTKPLLLGVGKFGTKIVNEASKKTKFDYMLISNNLSDLDSTENSVYVDCSPWLNPTVFRIRGFVDNVLKEIKSRLDKYSTIIIIANLASTVGIAMAPILSNISKANDKTIVSFVTMPLGFETDKLYDSSVSLKKLFSTSSTTFIINNDAFIKYYPSISIEDLYRITNSALIEVIKSISKMTIYGDKNVISTSVLNLDFECTIKDSIGVMLSSIGKDSIGDSIIQVSGINNESVGNLDQIFSLVRNTLAEDSNDNVAVSVTDSGQTNVNIITSIKSYSIFDSYDPLSIIPDESWLDRDEIDSALDINLPLINID
jgi:cell division protein FtsZ